MYGNRVRGPGLPPVVIRIYLYLYNTQRDLTPEEIEMCHSRHANRCNYRGTVGSIFTQEDRKRLRSSGPEPIIANEALPKSKRVLK